MYYGILQKDKNGGLAFFTFRCKREAENWYDLQTSYPIERCKICGRAEAEEEAKKIGKSLAQAIANTEGPDAVYTGK